LICVLKFLFMNVLWIVKCLFNFSIICLYIVLFM
jgi:hypothetical protein